MIAFILSLVACAAAVSVGFAWMLNADFMHGMQFQILQIDSTVNFYSAKDENYNGVPDLLSSENEGKYEEKDSENWTVYSTAYYTEKYQFKLIDNKYMLSTTTTANTFENIQITDAAPSRIHTYKAQIVNYSGFAVNLRCSFGTVSDEKSGRFQCRIVTVSINSDTVSYTPSDWKAFGEVSYETRINGDNNDNKLDFWLQIRMDPFATDEMKSLQLPDFKMVMNIDDSSAGT